MEGVQMERITRQERRAKAHALLMETLKEWRDDKPEALEALDVSHRLVSHVELELFGPTTWIEYDHATGRGKLFTSRWSEEAGTNETISAELTEAESVEVAERFGLDYVEGLTIESDGTISEA